MTDAEWHGLVKAGEDAGWERVWLKVVEPESKSMRSAELMKKYSITAGDLMGMLYEDMIGRNKIGLYRGEGSFEGWLRKYVRGYILAANPAKHGEISLDAGRGDSGEETSTIDIPVPPGRQIAHNEVWDMTMKCFSSLWNEDPERAYIHLLKTQFHLSSAEIKEMLDVSSVANVDKIFSRNIKFMRQSWVDHDRNG